jgi:cell division protein ZapA (FtsZ GTPase activity inhibitor)
MEEKLSIKVNIADRYYPLKIDRNEEETIRRAAKMINDRVTQYKQRYTDKDMQDFMAMASLQFVTRLLESNTKPDSAMVYEIQNINQELEEYLQKA